MKKCLKLPFFLQENRLSDALCSDFHFNTLINIFHSLQQTQQAGFGFLTSLNIDVRPCVESVYRVMALESVENTETSGIPGPRAKKKRGIIIKVLNVSAFC